MKSYTVARLQKSEIDFRAELELSTACKINVEVPINI